MDQNIPDWLTIGFLSQCLQSKEKYTRCKVTSFTAERAIPPGNNYGSHILRIKLNYKEECVEMEKELSLIAKCPLVDGAILDLYPDISESEPLFYNQYLKIGYKLLDYHFAPDNFHSPIDAVIVLEDLKEQGYKMADKSKQLDFDHCRCYMVAAANFHAMSVAVNKQNPELINFWRKETMFSNDLPERQINVEKNNIRYGIELMSEKILKELGDEQFSKLLRACSTTLWDQIVDAIQSNQEFKCLSQGDPWITNMMFRYNENGVACDTKLLDFQCLMWGSPVEDLVFFIWSSANKDVIDNKTDELHRIYLDTLNKRLNDMKLEEHLTMKTLKKLILKQSPLALWTAATCLPIFVNTTVNDLDPLYKKLREDYSPDNNPLENLYDENYSKNHFPQLIHQLKTAGVFEYLEKKMGIV